MASCRMVISMLFPQAKDFQESGKKGLAPLFPSVFLLRDLYFTNFVMPLLLSSQVGRGIKGSRTAKAAG